MDDFSIDTNSVKSEHTIDVNNFHEAQTSLLAGIQHIHKLLPRLKNLEIVKTSGSCQVQTFRNNFKFNRNFQHSSWTDIYRKDILKGLDVDPLKNLDMWPAIPSNRIIAKTPWEDVKSYLESFKARLSDETNRLLVVGDLNSGKSSLVNSLLGRNVVCVDQMPLTACFCEVIAGKQVEKEIVHAIVDMEKYDFMDPTTFETYELSDLKTLLADDPSPYEFLKVYVSHHFHNQSSDDFLEKMSLIDSPGLNIDAEKTLNLFRKQREIDVVVFVVNAENMITYSAQEFLKSISNEKLYFFLIINKFDNIVDKSRCKRDILSQLKKLNQFVSDDTSKMVHFVSAKKVLDQRIELLAPSADDSKLLSNFANFESHLKKFIVLNKTASKLLPAKKFMCDLLKDCLELVDGNIAQHLIQFVKESDVLISTSPKFVTTVERYEETCIRVNRIVKDTVECIQIHIRKHLERFIQSFLKDWPNVNFSNYPSSWGRDVKHTNAWLSYRLEEAPLLPEWRGAFDTLAYARDLQDYFNDCLAFELTVCEQKALLDVKEAISEILNLYASIDIPSDFLEDSPEAFIKQQNPRGVHSVNQILKENWSINRVQEILQSSLFNKQFNSLSKVQLVQSIEILPEPRVRPKAVGLFDIITATPTTNSLIVPHFFLSVATFSTSCFYGIKSTVTFIYNFFTNTPVIFHSTTLATTALMLARLSDVLSFLSKTVEVGVNATRFIYNSIYNTLVEVGSFATSRSFSMASKSNVKPLYVPQLNSAAFDPVAPLQLPNRQMGTMERLYGLIPSVYIPSSYIYGASLGIFGILYLFSVWMYYLLLY